MQTSNNTVSMKKMSRGKNKTRKVIRGNKLPENIEVSNCKFNQLSEYTRIAKYARYVPELKRRETWREQIIRVRNMHLTKYRDFVRKSDELSKLIKFGHDFIFNKKILPSMRSLQFGGKSILGKNTRIYNCSASYIDRVEVFQHLVFMLLCGVGVGFSVQKHHVEKLPTVLPRKKGYKKYIVDDSIEGWANCVGVLMSSYFTSNHTFPDYAGYEVIFDLTNIRKKGTAISNCNGKAPGPRPLAQALFKIKKVINMRIENQTGECKLRPIDVYDIIMHSSDAVLAGGVRRSATISIFSIDDDEMMKAKTGNWFAENPQRARSNNSVLLLRKHTKMEKFERIFNNVKQFGEPGFIWADSTETLFNPCVEACLYGYDNDGNSGFQVCNLTEINMGNLGADTRGKSMEEDFYDRCKAASIIGTLQAGYTDFGYLGNVTKKNC